jgi:hypothetical protein
MAPRFETVRIGALSHDGVPRFDVRIVRAVDGAFHAVVGSALGAPHASLEEASRVADLPPGVRLDLRDGLSPRPGDVPCPTCAAPVAPLPRHPRALCAPCVLEATDDRGRVVHFHNASMSGGVRAAYEDGGAYASVTCWVRGVRCRAEEGRFGGVVVSPES